MRGWEQNMTSGMGFLEEMVSDHVMAMSCGCSLSVLTSACVSQIHYFNCEMPARKPGCTLGQKIGICLTKLL